ncbi:phosphatidate cytidylyltransferase [Haloferula sp. A504]|uniref:phosphatidate cytidylyltransferase n=1 Tax=Haloferula sp. A504 TaxID=3373601 RepID=UPI0031BD8BB4|nr:phosphatidate cytidylyltransferase [Verrucomicrobiaceae bacterium E54]
MTSVPAKDSKALTFVKRTSSTLGLWAVVTLAFVSRIGWAYVALIGLLVVLATIEYFRMLKDGGVKGFPGYTLLLTIAYSVGLYAFLLGDGVPVWFDGLAIFASLAGAFVLQLRRPVEGLGSITGVAMSVLGFLYIAFFFNFGARVVFAVPGPGEVPGAMLLLWGIAVTKFTDMGAYIVGSAIGRHKMCPHISPGKTWQGFGGAIAFALLAGCGLYALFQDDMPNFSAGLHVLGGWGLVIGLSIALALVAVVGDLAESVLKRSLSVKDSGQVLPGIGGALDLIDSMCFTLPLLYFYVTWVTG